MTRLFNLGFTCGSFDLCHIGHIRMFKECKEHCDYLLVGVQSDPTLDRPEKNKPIQSLEERIEIISSIKYVDKVIPYTTERSLYSLLLELDPDVRFLGEDWRKKDFTGYDLEIPIYFISRKHNYSSSNLRKSILFEEFKRVLNEEVRLQ